MPSVKKNENESDYISRCMSSAEAMKERPDQKARLGLCYGLYRAHKKKMESEGSMEEPKWEEIENQDYFLID
ncbi:MAG: hypothetical protein AABY22_19180 [Nanoarchaeota archaeon]